MAIFGNDNADLLRQIIDQLGRLGSDLAALKQQVADQQHAIDQARQDTRADIGVGLTEIRGTVRDGLDRGTERTGDNLTHIAGDLGGIRDTLNRLDRKTDEQAAQPPTTPVLATPAEPTAVPEPEPEPERAPSGYHDSAPPAPQAPETGDDKILRAAAGISRAKLRAHRDTWAFLVEHAIHDRHFRVPGQVTDADGAVTVHVSGPSLVAAITSLNDISRNGDSAVTRAIAGHLHDRLTETVKAITAGPRRSAGDEVQIIIDDRPAGTETEPGNEARPDEGQQPPTAI